jgi:hypothetical protein
MLFVTIKGEGQALRTRPGSAVGHKSITENTPLKAVSTQ